MVQFYAQIEKSEKQDDGTLKVFGYASSEAIDRSGEIIKADAVAAALPDYLKFGAVREMHDSHKAAGTAIEAVVQDDGRLWFGAHIVDPVAIKKVETEVYKGFSLGGKVTGRDELQKSIITGLRLTEISLVDRPANPDAVFTLIKADASGALVEAGGEPLAKGLYEVGELGKVLQSLTWLAGSVTNEAGGEKDGSAIPGRLVVWIGEGLAILKDMTTEESAEALAALQVAVTNLPPPPVEVTVELAMAEAVGDLQKRGMRNSKEDRDRLAKIHDLLVDAEPTCCPHGAAASASGDGSSTATEGGDDATKAESAAIIAAANDEFIFSPETLAKALDKNTLTKALGLEGLDLLKVLGDVGETLNTVAKRLDVMERQPAAGAPSLRALGKTEDFSTGGRGNDTLAKVDELPPEQRALAAIAAIRGGGRR